MCNKTLLLDITIVSDGKTKERHGLFVNEEGRIADVFSMDDFDAAKYGKVTDVIRLNGETVTPGLIDTHIHGIGGFATDDATQESILGMSRTLARFGVTSFFPTLYAGKPDKMIKEAKAIVEASGKEEGAKIAGIHFEGPFISPDKAGAQDPESIIKPDARIFESFIESSKGLMKAMTIAPEVGDYKEIVGIAQSKGIVLLVGHTNATYDQTIKAIDDGFRHCTHMYNAMRDIEHKEPGVAGATLFDDRMHCELIADAVHVHKDIVTHTIKSKPEDNIILITDSLKPTTLGQSTFNVNGDDVILSENGAFVLQKDHSKLCGSALTLNNAVKNVSSWGFCKAKSFKMATKNPAALYGLKDIGSIAKGYKASIVIWNNDFTANRIMIDGNWFNI